MRRIILSAAMLIVFVPILSIAQQSPEILLNADVILLTKSGLSQGLIVQKIIETKNSFDLSVKALVELKSSGVAEDIIRAMMDRRPTITTVSETPSATGSTKIESVKTNSLVEIREPQQALRVAKNVAIDKSSIFPARQELEKALLKREDWRRLNLNIVREKALADVRIEIGRIPLTWISHRYVFRIYDVKSGTVITAGETTSWGSLANNLAREICQKLKSIEN